jgi:hypothetical protein
MTDPHQAPKQHRWLKWVGLQEPPVDPEAWMAVVKDLAVDDAETGVCEAASRVAEALKAAGIEAHQRVYVRTDQGRVSGMSWGAFVGGTPAADRVKVAVLVHNRDLEQATSVVAGLGEYREVEVRLADQELAAEGHLTGDIGTTDGLGLP